jgi:hypothetical protein
MESSFPGQERTSHLLGPFEIITVQVNRGGRNRRMTQVVPYRQNTRNLLISVKVSPYIGVNFSFVSALGFKTAGNLSLDQREATKPIT